MSGEAVIMTVVALVAGVYCVVWLIRRMPVPPDPWESEMSPEELDDVDTPVCVRCLEPVASPGQHYCPACGNVTGEFTRYVPFVSIPFNYSLFSTLWARIRNPHASPAARAFAFAVILLIAPGMLLVGLPVLLVGKLRGKRSDEGHGTA